jgi:hypothetical protein
MPSSVGYKSARSRQCSVLKWQEVIWARINMKSENLSEASCQTEEEESQNWPFQSKTGREHGWPSKIQMENESFNVRVIRDQKLDHL